MEKLLLTFIGIVFLSVIIDAQDIGRMRRLMLLRQRELALRRGGFPFGIRGVGGPGIPPPVAARLAMIERQRALRGGFLRSPLGPLGTPFSPFVPGPMFGPVPFGLTGPTDISRFDLSTLGFPTEATFGGPEGLPISTTGGMTTVGENSIASMGSGGPAGVSGQQGGSGNIFGQQPTQAEEFLEANRGTVEQRSRTNTDVRSPNEPPMPGFLPPNAEPQGSRSDIQEMSRPQDSSQNRGRRPPPRFPGERFPRPPRPPFLPPVLPLSQPQLGELRLQPLQPPLGPRRMPERPSRRREHFEAQRSRRMQRQGQGQRPREQTGPRVFPNVPSVVQIPSVTPTAQGQPGDSQVGPGQMGGQSSTMGGQVSGQMGGVMGGQMGGAMGGPMGGAMGGPMGGQVPGSMSGSFGGTMTGSMGGSMSGPMGRSMSGPIGGSIGGSMGGAMGGQMVGGPMGRQVSGQMGGSIGGAMGGPMAGRPMGGAIGGPFGMPMGGSMRGPMSGPMRGPGMGPFRGPVGGSVGSPFGSQFTGPTFSFSQPSGGQFSTGSQTQGQEGSAIFPSQATQGPVIRQRGPGFTTESGFPPGLDMSGSSTVGIPAFPNGPALPFPAGAPGFGQSDPFMFPAGGFQTDVLSGTDLQASRFPGFPASSFGQRFGVNVETSSVPGFDATPTRRQSNGINSIGSESISDGSSFRPATFGPTINAPSAGQSGQSVGGSRSQGQVTQSFGFVGPSNNAGAGPAFNTDTQSSQNFNIQFQPLQPGPVPQIPALQPNQGQIGVDGTVVQTNAGQGNGFTNQENVQFGSSSQTFQSSGSNQGGFQFGGSSQGGFQTGNAGQNSQFIVSDGPTVVETRTNQQNGGMTFGSNSQSSNNAATTVSERTVETGGATGNTEFRLVEVGNILGDKGFVNNDAGSSSVVVTETISTNQGADFQPVGDINTAFRSFESVAGSNNVVDLSLEPTLSMTGNTVTTPDDATGSTTVTNTTETRSIMSVQDGPFAASLNQNQDFSFFMTDNTNEAPNEMPPITFNAPPPPVVGPEGPAILTFAVEGMANTGNEMPTISKQEISSSSNSFTIASGGETVLGPDQSGASTTVEEAKPLSALP